MLDIRIIKTSYDMDDRIRLTDIRKKLVAKTFSLGSTLDKTSNIRELKRRVDNLLRMEELDDLIHSLIRNLHDADIRIDRRKRIVLSQNLAVRDGVEQRGLAYIRQSDNSCC